MNEQKQIEARQHLIDTYPSISKYLQKAPLQSLSPNKGMHIGDAIVKVVTSQMLSRSAASTISSRIFSAADDFQLAGTWELPIHILIECGLSKAKCRTIHEFSVAYKSNKCHIDSWPNLNPELFHDEICKFWGMSSWTASILSIFYFGHEDVFPKNDGSILRSLAHINIDPNTLDVDVAAPYRSYLALYLWSILDDEIYTQV